MAHELEFTASSFLRIATLEARRGRDDPGQMFPAVNAVINDLKNIHKQRRDVCAKEPDRAKARELYGSFRPQIAELQRKKRHTLDAELHRVSAELSEALSAGSFSWGLEQGALRKSRQTFRIARDPGRYFSMKQLEINIKRAHSVAAPNRNRLTAQLRDSLEGQLPRYIFRTDLASFYDSVPHANLQELLLNQGELSRTSLSLIRLLLDEWRVLTGKGEGLPTGVGLSAYLGEVYAHKIDRAVAGIPAVHFYGRYVDDIVVVARTIEGRDAIEERLNRCVAELGLTLNSGKTRIHGPEPHTSNATKSTFDIKDPIEFLGYAISKVNGQVAVEMTQSTVERYKRRLNASFEKWASAANPSSGHNGLLLDRVRFLAGNTKLVNSKGRAVTGIFFNYPHLGNGAVSLFELDDEFQRLVSKYAPRMGASLIARLQRVSFAQGHASRTYHRYRQSDLERLVAVWRE